MSPWGSPWTPVKVGYLEAGAHRPRVCGHQTAQLPYSMSTAPPTSLRPRPISQPSEEMLPPFQTVLLSPDYSPATGCAGRVLGLLLTGYYPALDSQPFPTVTQGPLERGHSSNSLPKDLQVQTDSFGSSAACGRSGGWTVTPLYGIYCTCCVFLLQPLRRADRALSSPGWPLPLVILPPGPTGRALVPLVFQGWAAQRSG